MPGTSCPPSPQSSSSGGMPHLALLLEIFLAFLTTAVSVVLKSVATAKSAGLWTHLTEGE